MSVVSQFTPAAPADAAAWFAHKLSFETDCADVHHAMQRGEQDFVLLHVIGSHDVFARRHLPGALHLPHREINAVRMAQWPAETLFVVYCAGPHCNGADIAALKLAQLGRPVKMMLGGLTGWADEGFAFSLSEASNMK
ncbi:rhodanese-like domain-containing protein [Klebsiella aerogenes]|uniref:rhodanese-like domain-containing protein n=1 Tax=Klebsiella aerogenes TaxID=548 RepID=UPI0012AC8D98|nr:rhodanese-like domain-containing protein [Klebsiella aerogenes]HCR0846907.1 rhodanese-like domain-containing protein [Klebsiella aerogenes]